MMRAVFAVFGLLLSMSGAAPASAVTMAAPIASVKDAPTETVLAGYGGGQSSGGWQKQQGGGGGYGGGNTGGGSSGGSSSSSSSGGGSTGGGASKAVQAACVAKCFDRCEVSFVPGSSKFNQCKGRCGRQCLRLR